MRIVTRSISSPCVASRRRPAYQSTSTPSASTSKRIVRPSSSARVTISAAALPAKPSDARRTARMASRRIPQPTVPAAL